MNPQYINSNRKLKTCISALNRSEEIAVDLEFDKNRYRYGFNLCLVQIYSGRSCYLIDPLSEKLDIEELFPVLENDQIQKVVFAFGEDLRLLHSLGCFPRNIFDISIATGLLNYPPSSLTSLLADILKIDAGKSSQTSNWYKRPLSEEQKMYAAQDVIHLPEIKKVLLEEAIKKNITSWIAEENAVFDELNYSEEADNRFLKEKDKSGLTEQEWHVFKQLMSYREDLAKYYNRPSYQIIDKGYLTDIAKNPEKLAGWNKTKGIFKAVRNGAYREKLSDLVDRSIREAQHTGLSASEPAIKPLSDEESLAKKKEQSRINRIRNTLLDPIKKRIAEKHGKHAASYMLSNRIMTEIISGKVSPENYKMDLILYYAEELNKDLEVVLEVVK
ncbi:MAG: hypothetical protein WD317_06300 [Balneolaceae bacterium]